MGPGVLIMLIPLHIEGDFDVHAEEHDGRVWLHHRVYRWGPGVLKRVLRELDRILLLYRRDLWVLDNDPEVAPLLPKYLARLGFAPFELVANDGRIRIAFVKRF